MKISMDWINDYVDIKDLDIRQLADKFTIRTAEIEGIEYIDGDAVIEIDNKSLTNRPDLWCHYGIAREIAAITGRALRKVDCSSEAELRAIEGAELDIEMEESGCCLRYSAIALKNLKPAASPELIAGRLAKCGIQTNNLIVDLANYVMLDTGLPLHTFDRRQADGIKVYTSSEKQSLTTLDGVERELPAGTVVIGNGSEPIGAAGIMGGLHSAVSESTGEIILEAAVFDGVAVRKSAAAMGLRTDASARYEKFLDTSLTTIALGRFLRLLQKYQPEAEAASRLYDKCIRPTEPISIKLPHKYIETYLGNSIASSTVSGILESLGFGVTEQQDAYDIAVPVWRATKDISSKADIIEEILRIYGYENIKSRPSKMQMVPTPENSLGKLENHLKDILTDKFSYSEVHTYCWYDNDWIKKLNYEAGDSIKIANSGIKQYEKLRTSLLPNLLKVIYDNRKSFENIRIYEAGRIYRAAGEGCEQPKYITAVAYGSEGAETLKKDFLDMKGMSSLLLRHTKNLIISYVPEIADYCWADPAGGLGIYHGTVLLGHIYALHPSILKLYGSKAAILAMELDLEAFDRLTAGELHYKPLYKYPDTYLDFSLLTPLTMPYGDIESLINGFSGENLLDITYISTYEGDNIPQGCKSTTIRMRAGSSQRTLRLEEITALQQSFIEYLERNGIKLR